MPDVKLATDTGVNAFESKCRGNAPQRRISLSNRLKLVLKHP